MQDSVNHMPLKLYLIHNFREHFTIRKHDVSVDVNAQHKEMHQSRLPSQVLNVIMFIHNYKYVKSLYTCMLYLNVTMEIFMRDTGRCDNSHAPLVCPK